MKSFLMRSSTRFASVFAALALMITVYGANSACFWISHQAEMPEKAKKLRKF